MGHTESLRLAASTGAHLVGGGRSAVGLKLDVFRDSAKKRIEKRKLEKTEIRW